MEQKDKPSKKKKAVFMVDTIEHPVYATPPFNIESRTDTYLLKKNTSCLKGISSTQELNNFIEADEDEKCIILDSDKVPIDSVDFRKTINNFMFYLALPGVSMPLGHNLVVAMSTGAIPILSKEYNRFLSPKLKHMHNAIIYDNLEDLITKIEQAYKIDSDCLLQISANVKEY